jgi:hypothetical protein
MHLSPAVLMVSLRSSTRTLWPFLVHSIAAVRPARPVPTTSTSIPVEGYEPTGFASLGVSAIAELDLLLAVLLIHLTKEKFGLKGVF